VEYQNVFTYPLHIHVKYHIFHGNLFEMYKK